MNDKTLGRKLWKSSEGVEPSKTTSSLRNTLYSSKTPRPDPQYIEAQYSVQLGQDSFQQWHQSHDLAPLPQEFNPYQAVSSTHFNSAEHNTSDQYYRYGDASIYNPALENGTVWSYGASYPELGQSSKNHTNSILSAYPKLSSPSSQTVNVEFHDDRPDFSTSLRSAHLNVPFANAPSSLLHLPHISCQGLQHSSSSYHGHDNQIQQDTQQVSMMVNSNRLNQVANNRQNMNNTSVSQKESKSDTDPSQQIGKGISNSKYDLREHTYWIQQYEAQVNAMIERDYIKRQSTLSRALPPYYAPPEFTIPIRPTLEFTDYDVNAYYLLDSLQRLLIFERIMAIRPHNKEAIRKRLKNYLIVPAALDLLSYDVKRIEKAVEMICPFNLKQSADQDRGAATATYMVGLSNAQR
jgi:hypothetical protein